MEITKKQLGEIWLTEEEMKKKISFLREIDEDESFEYGLGYGLLSEDNYYHFYHGLDSNKKKVFEEMCMELYCFGLLTGMRGARDEIWQKVQDLIR